MEESLELLPVDREFPQLEQLFQLYEHSFPEYERKPFKMILQGVDEGAMEAYACMDQNELVGLAFIILGRDAVVLDYLAVSPEKQNQRYGSRILDLLKTRYQKPLIVEIESTRHADDPYRQKRKDFYLRNGFFDCQSLISLFGVEMELLSTLRIVPYLEYEEIMHRYFRRRLHQYLHPIQAGDIQ